MNDMVKIYSLKCPFTDQVRYVGQTIYPLETRLKGHLTNPANDMMREWIKSLDNLKPTIEEIDEVEKIDADYYEMYWINQFKAWGFTLFNKTIFTAKWRTTSTANPKIDKNHHFIKQLKWKAKMKGLTVEEFIEKQYNQPLPPLPQRTVEIAPKTIFISGELYATVRMLKRDNESIGDYIYRVMWLFIEENEKWGFSFVPPYVKEKFPNGMPDECDYEDEPDLELSHTEPEYWEMLAEQEAEQEEAYREQTESQELPF